MKPKLGCILAIAVLSTACHKNKTAAQPPVTTPPTAHRTARPRRAQTAPPAIPAGPSQAPPMEAPRLAQMLSRDEERQYNISIDTSLSDAQANLQALSDRKLTEEQQNSVRQIQDLVRQANELRKTDLMSAKRSADKAAVLAKDLVRGLK